MSKMIDLINSIFDKGDKIILNDRVEFRLNSKEKILIKKYCKLKYISTSEFFSSLAMKEIDNFIKINS